MNVPALLTGDVNGVGGGDLLIAAENVRFEIAQQRVIVVGNAHNLAELCQARDFENLGHRLQGHVADALRLDVVEAPKEGHPCRGGGVRLGAVDNVVPAESIFKASCGLSRCRLLRKALTTCCCRSSRAKLSPSGPMT